MRNHAWLHHQKLIKTTSSSSIRSACSSSGLRIPDRLIDFRPAFYSAIFTVSNVNAS